MSPDVLIAFELLAEATYYAANDYEHAAWPLKKLQILLEWVEKNRMTTHEVETVAMVREKLEEWAQERPG